MTDSPLARTLHPGSGAASRYGIAAVVVVVAVGRPRPPAVARVAADPFPGAAARRSRTLLA